jgi:hypothetical protein
MNATDDSSSPANQDAVVEAAVLRQLLHLHPAQVTLAELLREIGGGSAGFAETDAISRAVRDLTAAGLLHTREDFVLPSRAALRFSELLDR